MPTGGSATCRMVSLPKIVTVPCGPAVSVNTPPTGTIANATNAVTAAM